MPVWVLAAMFLAIGCAGHRGQAVGPTAIEQAVEEIPEELLLDVGIEAFDSAELTDKQAQKEGTNAEIRKAECHFIPYHLKNTLQLSSHWGGVRLIPRDSGAADLVVGGEVISSSGEDLVLRVWARDASGTLWLDKTYHEKSHITFYDHTTPGEADAFQDLYNTVANDITRFKSGLTPEQIRKIRQVARLKFAEAFAPEAFEGYLVDDGRGVLTPARLPADDDPQMARIAAVRERDYMYVDTLDGYYEGFYNQMWPAYENWRKANYQELTALRKVKRDALVRQISGALMLAAAVALDVGQANNTRTLQNILILGGGSVIINGFNISKEAEIHRLAIEELSESFGMEMEPVSLELQGRQVELSGTVEEQYTRWRELLREIYIAETGFELPPPPE